MSTLRSYSNDELSKLYDDHQGWLKGWLRKKLGDAADAADLTQETFLKILRHNRTDPVIEPRPYLATIAKSVLIDFIRRRRLEQSYLEALEFIPEVDLPSTEDQAIIVETLMELDAMLNGLGYKVKQAFLYAQFEDMNYAEIAQKLDVSVRTIKNYMAKAMEHICLFRLRNGL
jgi:RNA polymerase sigma factor (sigma-70 family)